MLQLLIRYTVDDHAKWKEVYDNHREDRSGAGLSQLQIWRDTANAQSIWCLYEVADQSRASAYLDDPKTEMVGNRAGITGSETYFLETA